MLQFAPRVGEVETNRRLTVNAVAAAVGEHRADIVVLPELCNSGYMFQSPQEAASLAITREDALFKEWAAEASRGDAVVIGGFCERGDDGQLYNSAAVVEGRGIIGVYRKTHLWDREKLYFKPGSEVPGVFDTPHGRIGVLVCYDIEFPEMTRTLALAGAELIAVPTNWPLNDRPDGERPPEVTHRPGRGPGQPRVHRLLRPDRHRARPGVDRRHRDRRGERLRPRIAGRHRPGEGRGRPLEVP